MSRTHGFSSYFPHSANTWLILRLVLIALLLIIASVLLASAASSEQPRINTNNQTVLNQVDGQFESTRQEVRPKIITESLGSKPKKKSTVTDISAHLLGGEATVRINGDKTLVPEGRVYQKSVQTNGDTANIDISISSESTNNDNSSLDVSIESSTSSTFERSQE